MSSVGRLGPNALRVSKGVTVSCLIVFVLGVGALGGLSTQVRSEHPHVTAVMAPRDPVPDFVGVPTPDGSRHRSRDLFPLPSPVFSAVSDSVSETCASSGTCRSVRRRALRKQHLDDVAIDAVTAVNQLAGRGQNATSPSTAACAASLKVRDAVFAFGGPPSDCTPREGALGELLSSARCYTHERADLHPYVKEKVSWPGAGSRGVLLSDLLSPADRAGLTDWKHHMLADSEVSARAIADSGLSQPY